VSRWLLNNFPTWAIGLIIVGVLVLTTLVGLWLVRRLLPRISQGEANDFAGSMAGVIAAVYGVFLAITVVALYEQMQETESNVDAEAVVLARLVRDADAFDPRAREKVHDAVRQYRDGVVGPEWDAMEEGEQPPKGRHALEAVIAAVREFEPRGPTEIAFYEETVAAITELIRVRRARLHGAEASLPSTFMILLFGGALMTIAFTVVFGVANARMHAALAIALAVLLGFCLLAAVLLAHPFSGDVAIDKDPYFLGTLGRL
jgi:hypothetical protein